MADKTQKDTKAPEVKKLIEAGLSVREVAKLLDLSTQGVHWHLKRLGLRPVKRDAEVAS